MKALAPQNPDRVESFISTIDSYEPTTVRDHEDAFRIFARFVSRSVDGRYLDRHPPQELLPDLEHLMATCLRRTSDEIIVRLHINDDPNNRRGILITCMPDQNFIFSIVRLGVESLRLKTYRSLNSIIPISRDAQGQITSVGVADAPRESFIWMEVDADDIVTRRAEIEKYIAGRLEAARSLVEDFTPLKELVQKLAGQFETLAPQYQETRARMEDNARLLRWLLNEHFVFLGTRYLPGVGSAPNNAVGNFGIGRFDDWRGVTLEQPQRDVQELSGRSPYLWMRKSKTESWIYRSGRTDQIFAQTFTPDGKPAGLLVIEGIFSYPALAEPTQRRAAARPAHRPFVCPAQSHQGHPSLPHHPQCVQFVAPRVSFRVARGPCSAPRRAGFGCGCGAPLADSHHHRRSPARGLRVRGLAALALQR